MNTKTDKPTQVVSSHEHKTKHTLYHFFGILCIIFALTPVLFVIPKYYHLHFTSFEDRNNALQSILGVPAFFITLAGILFVVDNLKLQRNTLLVQIDANKMQQEELKLQIDEQIESNKHFKEQNQTMLNQQADNTFFNLIELNKNLVTDINGKLLFTKLVHSCKNLLKEHSKNLEKAEPIPFSDTKKNPYYELGCVDIDYNQRLKLFITNVKDIIDFIDDKLSYNAAFYHKILYNLFTADEKYLLGLCMELRMFNIRKNPNFQYHLHFTRTSKYVVEMGFIPSIGWNLDFKKFKKNVTEKRMDLTIVNYFNQQDENIILKEAHLFLLDGNKTTISHAKNFLHRIDKPFNFDYKLELNDFFEYVYSEVEPQKSYNIQVNLIIDTYGSISTLILILPFSYDDKEGIEFEVL